MPSQNLLARCPFLSGRLQAYEAAELRLAPVSTWMNTRGREVRFKKELCPSIKWNLSCNFSLKNVVSNHF